MSGTKDWFSSDGGFLNSNNDQYNDVYGFSENDHMAIDGERVKTFLTRPYLERKTVYLIAFQT